MPKLLAVFDPPDRIAEAATRASISLDARGETLDVEAFARMASLLETGT